MFLLVLVFVCLVLIYSFLCVYKYDLKPSIILFCFVFFLICKFFDSAREQKNCLAFIVPFCCCSCCYSSLFCFYIFVSFVKLTIESIFYGLLCNVGVIARVNLSNKRTFFVSFKIKEKEKKPLKKTVIRKTIN